MGNNLWQIKRGNSPLVATAIHHGHEVRGEIAEILELDEANRLREEDPFTGLWTKAAASQLVVSISRFELDLNRPKDKAIYIKPPDAWGLHVWKVEPSPEIIARSLDVYDAFYAAAFNFFLELEARFGRFVVFDLHSYNHRRDGPDAPSADPEKNPEVNIGTGTMNRERWANVVDRFISDLHQFDYLGRKLDVRENIKFRGGRFVQWIHETFPESGCALAIEFKKFFMDEWTGIPDKKQLQSIRLALQSTVPCVLEELKKIK